MSRARILLLFLALMASQLAGLFVAEFITITQLDPYLRSQVLQRFDADARDWHQRLVEASDDQQAINDLMRDIQRNTQAEVTEEIFEISDYLDNSGVENEYSVDVDVLGFYLYIHSSGRKGLEVGPIPKTVLAGFLTLIVPLLTLALFAFMTVYAFYRTDLKAILQVLPHQDSPLGSPYTRLVNYIETLKIRNQNLEEATSNSIENQRDFLHGVAHEFRAPLARLRFVTDMDDETRNYRTARIVDEMDELVTEILQYSRYRHGQFDITMTTFDAGKLLESVASPLIDGAELQLITGAGIKAGIQVTSDSQLVERCLTNLVLNASRFAKSMVSINIVLSADEVAFVVEDDGPGVPPGKRDYIFDAFTRLDPSRARETGGTGLGLAIVAGIVTRLEAHVSVDDSPLGGALFEIRLPQNIQA